MSKRVHKKRSGLMTFEVYENRVVISKKRVFGTDKNVVPMSQITNVKFNGLTRRLTLKTITDKYVIICNIGGPKLRDAIIENMV